MSMTEALRAAGDRIFRRGKEDEQVTPPPVLTPVEEAERLVALAKVSGYVDEQSAAWRSVAGWAAAEILKAQHMIEYGDAQMLRARIFTLRELLALPQRNADKPIVVKDQAPTMP